MKTVLVVREFDKFSEILAENRFKIINLPLIKTAPLDDLKEFETRLANIEKFDGIFLTSAVASEIFIQKMRELKINFGGKVYVLGKRSFDLLQKENLDLFYDETANTAREMFEKIAPEKLKDKRFLFVRGEQSLRVVPEFLAKSAAVEEAIVYETKKIAPKTDKIKAISERIEKNEIACACFFSPSAVEVFCEHFDRDFLHLTNIAAIGKTTANCLEKRNMKVDFVSPKASAEDFANELIAKLN